VSGINIKSVIGIVNVSELADIEGCAVVMNDADVGSDFGSQQYIVLLRL
jgi:hypothetical protein